jgi:hypothetical protein
VLHLRLLYRQWCSIYFAPEAVWLRLSNACYTKTGRCDGQCCLWFALLLSFLCEAERAEWCVFCRCAVWH